MVAKRLLTALLLLLPIITSGLATFFLYRRPADVYVDFERHNEGAFVSGFHNHEKMDGRGFRWTAGEGLIHLENLPRRSRLRVEVRVKALRPRGTDLPQIRFTANDATVFETVCAPGLVAYRFGVTLPDTSLDLGIHSDVFIPVQSGRTDERALGIQVFSVHIEPQGGDVMVAGPMAWMKATAAVLLVSGLIAGLPLYVSSIAATGFSLGFVYLLSLDSLRFTPYVEQVFFLAAMTLGLCLILRWVLRRREWVTASERALLIGVLAGSFLFKGAVIFFPLFVSSDADFHGNRLLNVLEGDYFPTSVTQHTPPFRIPYPVSLYVMSTPWVAAGLSRVAAIKATVLLADLGLGLVLAFLARRFLKDFRAGVFAFVLYQLVPLNILTFSAGNFSNLFGTAMIVFFVGFLLAAAVDGGALASVGVFLFSLLALTAHFGSFLFAVVFWPALLGALFWAPPSQLKKRGQGVLIALVAGSFLLALLYYGGYWDLYTSQWERALTRDYASGQTAVEGPLAKLNFNLHFYREQLGIVFGVISLLGAIPLLSQPRASKFHSVAMVWVGVTVLFFFLDLTTALEVRYVLQALPLLALFAGRYLSKAVERGKIGTFASFVAFAYMTTVALRHFHECLMFRYH